MKTPERQHSIELENIKNRLMKDIDCLTIEKLFEIEQEIYYEKYRQQIENHYIEYSRNQNNFEFLSQY